MAELTETQRQVLQALIELYEKKKGMVKSREVALYLGKEEGTVRNIIVSLKNLGLVESRTGPLGGYYPTLKGRIILTKPTAEPIIYGILYVVDDKGNEHRYGILSLEIMDLFARAESKAVVKVIGDLTNIKKGYKARIESIPVPKITIEGTIDHVAYNIRQLLIIITRLTSVPDVTVGEIASRPIIYLDENMTLRDAATILNEKRIRGCPVRGEEGIIGFFTTTDLARAVARGANPDEPVSRCVIKGRLYKVRTRDTIFQAIQIMERHDVGRLLVVDENDRPFGIITRTDILKLISGLSPTRKM
ncbi:MAG: CBS domain-containing protein [Desulfurococcales archaeon]|nr:CBS domain-containing protein [Desulfurococcales archaeon]